MLACRKQTLFLGGSEVECFVGRKLCHAACRALCSFYHNAGCVGLQLSVIIENLLQCQCFDCAAVEEVTVFNCQLDCIQIKLFAVSSAANLHLMPMAVSIRSILIA